MFCVCTVHFPSLVLLGEGQLCIFVLLLTPFLPLGFLENHKNSSSAMGVCIFTEENCR